MAALLIGCLSWSFDRVSSKRRARKARDLEYQEHFEELKAENAKRVRNLSGASTMKDSTTGLAENSDPTLPDPPKYDDIAASSYSQESIRSASMMRTTEIAAANDSGSEHSVR